MRFKPFVIAGVVLGLISSALSAPAPQVSSGNPDNCPGGPTITITHHSTHTETLSLAPTSTVVGTIYSTVMVTSTNSAEASTVYVTVNPVETVEIGTPTATHSLTSTLISTETVFATVTISLTSTENNGASTSAALSLHEPVPVPSSRTVSLNTIPEYPTSVVIITTTIVVSQLPADATSPPAVVPTGADTTTELTSTRTVRSTVFITNAFTVIETVEPITASGNSGVLASGATAVSATGSSSTGFSPVGWNATTGGIITGGLPIPIAASSAPVASSSADPVAESYIISTVTNGPSLYVPFTPPVQTPSSYVARSGFGGRYGMVSQVSPVTATQPDVVQPEYITATIYGSVESWPNPFYTGTPSSSLASSTASASSSADPIGTSISAPTSAYTPIGSSTDRSSFVNSTTSSDIVSSTADPVGTSIPPSVVSYTPPGTAFSSSAASSVDPAGSSTSSTTVYYTLPRSSIASSSFANSTTSAASTASTVDPIGTLSSSLVVSYTSISSSSATSSYSANSTVPVSSFGTSSITVASAASSETDPLGNFTASTSSSSSSQILASSGSTLSTSSIVATSSYNPLSSNSSSSSGTASGSISSATISPQLGGYSFGPLPTASSSSSSSSSSVTMASPESNNVTTAGSSASSPSSASAAITISYNSLTSVSINHSSATSSSVKSATLTSARSSGYTGLSTANGTSTSSGNAFATPTACGEQGSFTLNWDDLPTLVANNLTNPNTIQPPPIFNPYHQFWFSTGFVDVPLPKDPYNPTSPPHLLEFITNFDAGTSTEDGPDEIDLGTTGEIGNGPYMALEYMAFNATGAAMGCDSNGADCSFQFTGVRYDPVLEAAVEVTTQTTDIAACPALNNCDLVPVQFDSTFTNLNALRINVTVDGVPKIWWMDDLQLGWYNNTCAAGLLRQSHR